MSERSSNDLELVVLIEGELAIFPLSAGSEVSLGRDAINHIQIDHPSVSRRHAVLRLGPPLVVEDLGSANGTFVHDGLQPAGAGRTERLRRLSSEGAELAVGESVQLGAVTAVVRHRHVAPPDGMIVRDPSLQAVYAQAERAAAAAISVLLLGETGVGKEVLARFIHARSPRAARPFVAINCAAFSEALLEGELFGYEKGAFTGAVQVRPGLFEAADGGTLFLDEVGELAQPTQAKFLRVFEERAVLRLGARAPRPVDARFIAATNRDLEAEVRAGHFREDLFYRLNGLSLAIPPLRERPGELESLARALVRARRLPAARTPPHRALARNTALALSTSLARERPRVEKRDGSGGRVVRGEPHRPRVLARVFDDSGSLRVRSDIGRADRGPRWPDAVAIRRKRPSCLAWLAEHSLLSWSSSGSRARERAVLSAERFRRRKTRWSVSNPGPLQLAISCP
jgi:two-component system, NtrC family, response regulator AtoC